MAYVTVPVCEAGFGVISTPCSSRALRISIVAIILVMTNHTLLSAMRDPGQTLSQEK